MTTLTFHVSRSIGATLEPGDEIVVTTLDHEANVRPGGRWPPTAGSPSGRVDIQPEDGTLDLEDLGRSCRSRTRLVAVGYASNAIGHDQPGRRRSSDWPTRSAR